VFESLWAAFPEDFASADRRGMRKKASCTVFVAEHSATIRPLYSPFVIALARLQAKGSEDLQTIIRCGLMLANRPQTQSILFPIRFSEDGWKDEIASVVAAMQEFSTSVNGDGKGLRVQLAPYKQKEIVHPLRRALKSAALIRRKRTKR